MKPNKPPPPRFGMSVPMEVATNPEAKIEYCRVIKLLEGKLDERDRSLLISYSLTHAEIIALRLEIEMTGGRMLEGPKGGMYINPVYNMLISREGQLAQLRRDLYFTPKSRIEKQNKATLSKARSIRDNIQKDDDNGKDED